jgi:hypothetical protein
VHPPFGQRTGARQNDAVMIVVGERMIARCIFDPWTAVVAVDIERLFV